MVAALFVEKDGAYYGVEGVDPWDEKRDARLYDGPWPVVAHPPCLRWSLLGLCCGYYDGEDEGCFEAALNAVRTWGGVLEHPAHTLAWKRFHLPKPPAAGWATDMLNGGWTCQVDQGRYGFSIQKPTWLYFVGDDPPQLLWGPSDRVGYRSKRVGGGPASSRRGALRSRTPDAFRDALLSMARSAHRMEAAA